MSDDLHDDGTVICQVHGLRYDPSVSTGCIRCPHKSVPAPKKKSSAAPPMAGGSIELDQPMGVQPPARRSWVPGANVPVPGSSPPPGSKRPSLIAPPGASTANMKPPSTIYVSRRTMLIVAGVAIVGAAYGVKRALLTGAQDVADRILPFTFPGGNGKESTGTFFLPTAAKTGKVPLLGLFEYQGRSKNSVARYAMLAEQHGWALASSDMFSKSVTPGDTDEMMAMIAHMKATYPVEDGRAYVAGQDAAASNAYRAALVKSDAIAGAIVELADDDVWREIGSLASGDLSFYLFARGSDATLAAMHVLRDEMPRRGFKVVYVEELGGHTQMGKDELEAAMGWLDAVRASG